MPRTKAPAARRRSPRELRAMAYALADEIETRANAIAAARGLPICEALRVALDEMAKG